MLDIHIKMFDFIFAYWYTKYYTFVLLLTIRILYCFKFSFFHLSNFYWCVLRRNMPGISCTYFSSPQPISDKNIDVLPGPTSTLLVSELVNAYWVLTTVGKCADFLSCEINFSVIKIVKLVGVTFLYARHKMFCKFTSQNCGLMGWNP